MCGRLAQVVALAIGWLTVCPFAHSQLSAPVGEFPSPRICQSSSQAGDELTSGPDITLAELKFEGDLRLPQATQDQIAAEIQQHLYKGAVDGAVDEVEERTRLGWQNNGYFFVEVSESSRRVLTSNPVSQRIAVVLHLEEGLQYRLKSITFKNNRVISNVESLRMQFPIADGDIFDREKISDGLKALRFAYGQIGYMNFAPFPDARPEDIGQTISLQINIDEGKQFYVSGVQILGLNDDATQRALKDLALTRGVIYDSRLVGRFLQNRVFQGDRPRRPGLSYQIDEKSDLVGLTLDFRPCSPE